MVHLYRGHPLWKKNIPAEPSTIPQLGGDYEVAGCGWGRRRSRCIPVGQRLPLLWAGCQAVPETWRLIPLDIYIYLHVYLVYYSWGGLQMGMSRPLDCQPAIQFHWRSKSCLRRFPTSLWGQPIASWSMFVDPVPRDCVLSAWKWHFTLSDIIYVL